MMMKQQEKERRQIDRVPYPANGVIVVCEDQRKLFVSIQDVSPLGSGVNMPADGPDILGKDIIIVTETLIMYADVVRQVRQDDGTYFIGVAAKKFTEEVLQYLFDRIAPEEK